MPPPGLLLGMGRARAVALDLVNVALVGNGFQKPDNVAAEDVLPIGKPQNTETTGTGLSNRTRPPAKTTVQGTPRQKLVGSDRLAGGAGPVGTGLVARVGRLHDSSPCLLAGCLSAGRGSPIFRHATAFANCFPPWNMVFFLTISRFRHSARPMPGVCPFLVVIGPEGS